MKIILILRRVQQKTTIVQTGFFGLMPFTEVRYVSIVLPPMMRKTCFKPDYRLANSLRLT